tara:strand:- start:1421 stop:1633 length:213 start_codon:yes stop_codon:yes gene_type:complete
MKYKDNEGNIYVGDVITLADGRILSGKTYTSDSKRLHVVEETRTVPSQPPTDYRPEIKKAKKKSNAKRRG